MDNYNLFDSMCRYIGQTVTVFTSSGGVSGSGFTGVLISCDCNYVRLVCDMGLPPACPVGSSCSGNVENRYTPSLYSGCNPLGSVCVIPTCQIVCFTHNAI